MKWYLGLVAGTLGITAATWLATGAEGAPTGVGGATTVLGRWHFAGAAAFEGDTNGVRLHAIWPHPLTQKLRRETFDKLALALARQAQPLPATNRLAPPRLRALLDDLLTVESYVEWRAGTGPGLDWGGAFALQGEPAARCLTQLTGWMQEVQGSPAAATTLDGEAGWEADLGPRLGRLTAVQKGDWLVLGGGGLGAVRGLLGQVKSTGRPVPALSKAWISLEVDVPKLAARLGWATPDRWPQVQWLLAGHGENVRSQGRFGFKEPPVTSLPEWRVPTRTIREDPARVPLVGFLAARGLGSWLGGMPWWRDLGVGPGPGQGYVWAQSQLPFHTFFAVEVPAVTNALQRVANTLPGVLGTNLSARGTAVIEYHADPTEVVWKGLPILMPSLRPAPDADYVLGGFFPMAPVTNPPPAALVAQVTSRTNLLLFEWEMVGARIPQWNILWQVGNMAAGKPDFTPQSTARQWLSTIGTNLLEAGTEITLESPQVLGLKHTSPLGLNSLAMVALTRWLDNPLFPAFERPPPTRPAARMPRPQPARPAQP